MPVLLSYAVTYAQSSLGSCLIFNLTERSSSMGLRGIDVMTGKSIFDICQSISVQPATHFADTGSALIWAVR